MLAAACLCTAAYAATVQMRVYNFDFSINPKGQAVVDVVVKAGDTVQWVWDEGFHSTTSVSGSLEQWDSTILVPPATFSRRFLKLGTFTYYCTFHGIDNGNGTASGMFGTVTVNPLPGDINTDGKVNVFDLQRLALSWNRQQGDTGYDPASDLTGDNRVNVFDLQVLANNWNQPQ